MKLITESYTLQTARRPNAGRHILAQFDADSVVVYQAYKPAIGRFAAEHGHFGGEWRPSRMSWIKTNFLWMMFRSGWGTKPDQEVTLAVRLRRSAFDAILAQAVHATFVPEVYGTREDWQSALRASDVQLNWDPDHDPRGRPVERRAIQLGLKGEVLGSYAREWIVGIEDVSDFVAEQRDTALSGQWNRLVTAREDVYPVTDPATAARLGISVVD